MKSPSRYAYWGPSAALLLLVVLAGVVAPLHAAAPVRGITLSTHRDGEDWGWDSIAPTLNRIDELGAGWTGILSEIEDEPRVIGAFLWKWFPEPHPVGRDFQLAVPHMLEVIRSVWTPETRSGSR